MPDSKEKREARVQAMVRALLDAAARKRAELDRRRFDDGAADRPRQGELLQ